MKKRIRGSEEDGDFTMTLWLNRDKDDYLIIYRNSKDNRVEYHVSKETKGILSLILTLYHKIEYFRRMITYIVHMVINDLLKIHADFGVENFKRTIKLQKKDNGDGNG